MVSADLAGDMETAVPPSPPVDTGSGSGDIVVTDAEPLLKIGPAVIGFDQPGYVIAEAGVNHNGSVDLAHLLIAAAAHAGADAVKFQTFEPDALVVPGARTAAYQRQRTGLGDQRAMLNALVLPPGAWVELRHDAEERGIEFLSTPFDEASLEALVDLGVRALKISSGDLTNHRLLRAARRTGLPTIVSTGASYLEEVTAAVAAFGGPSRLALLHCVTAYPTPIEASNLRAIATLAGTFPCPIGWSDHTVGATSAVAAVALGAKLFEKHLTLDTEMDGPDHRASADPDGFAHYIEAIRDAERALGDGVKAPQPAELDNRPVARRGLYATRDLAVGELLSAADVIALRPEAGLSASVDVTGHLVARPVATGEPLLDSSLGPQPPPTTTAP